MCNQRVYRGKEAESDSGGDTIFSKFLDRQEERLSQGDGDTYKRTQMRCPKCSGELLWDSEARCYVCQNCASDFSQEFIENLESLRFIEYQFRGDGSGER